MAQNVQPTGLNSLQISLLRLFNHVNEDEILSLKRVLVKHYTVQLNAELDKVTAEKGYTQEDYDQFLNAES